MESPTSNPEKRGPGRPRKDKRRERIDITLAVETIEYLDTCFSMNRSQFIEMCIDEHRKSHQSKVALT